MADIVVGVLITVTNHAAERYRQRVRGSLEEKLEVAASVARGREAGLVESGTGGTILIRDPDRPDLVYVCRPDGSDLVVVTLWEEGENAAVPRRFTDVLRRDDRRVN
jgi:hypothetical protein